MRKTNGAFTLVEIMIIIIIMGLLAAMAIPAFQKIKASSHSGPITAFEEAQRVNAPVKFSEKVWYFPETHLAFPKALAAFLDKNPDMEVTSSAPDIIRANNGSGSYSDYSEAVGYTVTVRIRKPILD